MTATATCGSIMFTCSPTAPRHADLVIVDGIEFNERFRYADPVADMAFLAMDLAFHGRRDLAEALADAYHQASGDDEGRALLPFYTSYRAGGAGQGRRNEACRARGPRGRARGDGEGSGALASGPRRARGAGPAALPRAGRGAARRRGSPPSPGPWPSGRALRSSARTSYARSWPAGSDHDASNASFASGIYTPQWTERTYSECLRRAEALLFEGQRVVVDASFVAESNRRRFLDLAVRSGVPGVLLLCHADPSVVRTRLESRRDDASDADWTIYLEAARRWEEPGPDTRGTVREIDTGADAPVALARALEILHEQGLIADPRPSASPDS